jgi:SAM-dependent methyltransferase
MGSLRGHNLRLSGFHLNKITSRFGFVVQRHKSIDPKGIFSGRNLEYDELGFWKVDPMPSELELNQYYESQYWHSRGAQPLVIKRDFMHFQMLAELIPESLSQQLTILNFGAGHGGISYLFWAAGHSVINLDPGMKSFRRDSSWLQINSWDQIPDTSVDLVYGSHSLEHVNSVENALIEVNRVTKSSSYIFWEVPNGESSGNGPKENKVYPPHTYYFTTAFFESEYPNCLVNATFNEDITKESNSWRDFQADLGKPGGVIRVLAAARDSRIRNN